MVAPNTQQLDFMLPDLGEGLEDAELIEWCVQPGQHVSEDDILAKMETAKALVDIPSPQTGTIAILHAKPGETVKVGAPLVTFTLEPAPPQSEISNLRSEISAPSNPQSAIRNPQSSQLGTRNPELRTSSPIPQSAIRNPQSSDAGTVVGNLAAEEAHEPARILAAPAVRRLARDLNVDIDQVRGTGVAGRITARDVKLNAEGKDGKDSKEERKEGEEEKAQSEISNPKSEISDFPSPPLRASVPPCSESPQPQIANRRSQIPQLGTRNPEPGTSSPIPQSAIRNPQSLSSFRRTLSAHLRRSLDHAVHFTVMDEADITHLEEFRASLIAAAGEKISLLPFVAAAVCQVLTGRLGADFARLNSTVDDEHQEITQYSSVHLGIAVDTPAGLMVPVIREAQHLGILELGRAIAAVAEAARSRTLAPDALSGSTFTLTNFGSHAGRFGTPIINYPEVAILGIGQARQGVVVRDGLLGVGKLLPLSLAADHRVIDGATAADALAQIITLLQSPQR